ncbi:hypothetical protein LINPERPRIM_LOCUS17838 [Linum perenne]
MEDFRRGKRYAYYWKVDGKELIDEYMELSSDLEILEMGLDVVEKSKYVHVYLINKEELSLELEDAAIVEMVRASQLRTSRAEAVEDNNPNKDVHSESEASSRLHDSDNEPSGDEKDAHDFEVQVERESLRIDTNIGVDVESDCGDSEELKSICSSDEEEVVKRRGFPQFNAERDMEDPHFEKGQEFADVATFKKAVKNYSIKNKREIKFKRSDSKRVQVVCRTNCPWNLWCVPTSNGVQITSCYLTHENCVLKFDNKFGDYHYIAKRYLQRFQVDPHWSASSLRQTVKEDLHWNISRWKAWRTKNLAKKLLRGSADEQYRIIREYCGEVRRSNVGSSVFVETTDDGVFRRMYYCLAACIDGNYGIFPIAYAMVGVENGDNWQWFLRYLCRDLGIDENTSGDWTFMSDKQKGLLNALTIVAPYAEHRCCVRHLWTNLLRSIGEAYNFTVSPMVGHESWQPSQRPPVKPPHVSDDDKKKRGRRQTKRRKGPEENDPPSSSQPRKHKPNNERMSRRNVTLRCTVCRKTGHNKSKHKNDTVPQSTPVIC